MSWTALLFANINWTSPVIWRWSIAAALLLLSLVVSLPTGVRHGALRRAGALLGGFAGLALIWSIIPRWGSLTAEAGFGVFAVVTVASAAATIASRSPVYSAIWFAVSLLGTAALLFLQGAQFLGVATVAVYAGAIVVTFLFVLMLAQPEGHAFYDRVGWGIGARYLAALTAVLLTLMMAAAATHPDWQVIDDHQALLSQLQAELAADTPGVEVRAIGYEARSNQRTARLTVALPPDQRKVFNERTEVLSQRALAPIQARHSDWQIGKVVFDFHDVKTSDHSAHLGSQLFSRQLVAAQSAGALLLAALVGAVAIVGRTRVTENQPIGHA